MASDVSSVNSSLHSATFQSEQAQRQPLSLPVRPPTDQEELATAISVLKSSLNPLNVQKLQEAAHAILSRGQTIARVSTRRLGGASNVQSPIPDACHPLPVVTALVESLRNPWLTADRDSQFLVARVVRLFSELTLLLSKKEPPLPIFSEDVQKLIGKDTGSLVLLIRNAEASKQPDLKFELQCAKEACKCWKSDDDYLRRYGPRLFDTIIDVVSMEGMHDAIKELRSISADLRHETEARWYRQVLSFSIIGSQATGDLQVFKLVHQRLLEPYKRMTAKAGSTEKLFPEFLKDKKLLMAGVDLLADLTWRGSPLIQTRALKGHDEDGVHYPGLLDLAAIEPQKSRSSLSRMIQTVSSKISKSFAEHLADIRCHACSHLHALTQHPTPRRDPTALSIAEESQKALSARQSLDTSVPVQSLVRELLQKTPSNARRSYLSFQVPSLWQVAQAKDLDQLVPELIEQLSQLKQKAEQCDQKLEALTQRTVEPAQGEEERVIAQEERRRTEERRAEYGAFATRIEAALQSLTGTVTHQYAGLQEGNRRIEDGMASVLAKLDSPPHVVVHLVPQSPPSPPVVNQGGPSDSRAGLADPTPSSSSASSQPDLCLLSINKLKRLALQGNPQAQCLLGQHYAKGELIARDEREAFKWFSLAAKQANPEALYQVGCCYQEGKGIAQNLNQAVAYFRQGAAANSASAMCQLAICYQKGYGGTTDYPEAFSLLFRASEMGLSLAHRLLGLCYEKGWGVERNEQTAQALYERAFLAIDKESCTGDPISLFALGQCYHHGQGVTQNIQEAAHWYELAADNRYAPAQHALASLFKAGINAQPPEKAIALFRLAAEAGHPDAQLDLAKCYQEGWGLQKNSEEEIAWYEKAAKQGLPEALYAVAISRTYVLGNSADSDEEALQRGREVIDLFIQAGKQGHAEAQYFLGSANFNSLLYYPNRNHFEWLEMAGKQGHVVAQFSLGRDLEDRDIKQAIEWYTRAALQGHADAQCRLGTLYFEGGKLSQDHTQAAHWYVLAADQEHPRAQARLGHCYSHGLGVREDKAEAVRLFKLAAKQNDFEGFCYLGWCYEVGRGIPVDLKESERYYELASKQPNNGSFLISMVYYKLGRIYRNGRNSDLYRNDYDRIKKGCDYLRMAASQIGIPYCAQAAYVVASDPDDHMTLGLEIDSRYKECRSKQEYWYNKAAEQGHRNAIYACPHNSSGSFKPKPLPEELHGFEPRQRY